MRTLRRTLILAAVVGAVALACRRQGPVGTTGPAGTGSAGSGFFGGETGAGGPGGSSRMSNANTATGGMATFSFFTQFQVDPPDEDSAGPKFVVAGDIDNDGLLDLASGWNQSQPVQIHLQRRDASGNVTFQSVTIAGTAPVTTLGGLRLADFNGDGFLDVAVAVKNTGFVAQLCEAPIDPPPSAACDPDATPPGDPCGPGCTELTEVQADFGVIILYLSPGDPARLTDGDNWSEVDLFQSVVAGRRDIPVEQEPTEPESNSYTDIEVGDLDGVNGPDIIVAFNEFVCPCGDTRPHNRVDVYLNPGAALVDDGAVWAPTRVEDDIPPIRDTALADIDGDGDLDIVVTYPNSISRNVRWVRNPNVPHEAGGPGGPGEVAGGEGAWEHRPIAHLDTGADVLAIGDVDLDGHDDVMVRSAYGGMSVGTAQAGVIQWFRNPNVPTREPIHPPTPVPIRDNFPWQVYTLAEFSDRVPEGLAVGDLTDDGQVEAVVGIEGAVVWLNARTVPNTNIPATFDEWMENAIVRDSPPDQAASASGAAEAPDTSTFINNVLVVDLDGDGFNDIVGTLDRRAGSGLSRDVLVWYRNNLGQRP